MPDDSIKKYWQKFQDGLAPGSPYLGRPYVAEGWGDSPALADELGELIAAGVKTATCSAVWEWQAEGEPWTKPGQLTIVLNGLQQPLCIVETIEVSLKAYNQVDAAFAFEEGEGDRSLAYWREAHFNFFSRLLGKLGKKFAQDMPLVCERFRLIYP